MLDPDVTQRLRESCANGGSGGDVCLSYDEPWPSICLPCAAAREIERLRAEFGYDDIEDDSDETVELEVPTEYKITDAETGTMYDLTMTWRDIDAAQVLALVKTLVRKTSASIDKRY